MRIALAAVDIGIPVHTDIDILENLLTDVADIIFYQDEIIGVAVRPGKRSLGYLYVQRSVRTIVKGVKRTIGNAAGEGVDIDRNVILFRNCVP